MRSEILKQYNIITDVNTLLNSLLNQVEKVNFRKLAFLNKEENNSKLLRKHYIIIVIDELIKISINKNWNLTKRNGNIFIFNGCYFQIVEKENFENFLGKVALKMGVDIMEAKYHQFQKELYLQFLSQSFLEINEIKDRVLINLKNGTLEISYNKINLRNFKYKDFLTYQLPFEFDKNKNCPLFKKFLDEVLPDESKQLLLAEYFGSVFIRREILKLEKMLILFGEGANGKSVIFEVFNAILGDENISNFSLENLTDRNGYYRAMIGQKLVNYASEISGKVNPTVLKQLASNEPVDARLPFGNPFTIKNYAKLIFNCNILPETEEYTNAFFRRFLIIKFDKIIEEKNQDKELANRIIKTELSGIFNWIIDGLKRLLNQKNFTYSSAIDKAILSYKRSSDSILLFLSENHYQKNIQKHISIQELFNSYRNFCFDWSYKYSNKSQFILRLKALGFEVKRMSSGFVIYIDNEPKN